MTEPVAEVAERGWHNGEIPFSLEVASYDLGGYISISLHNGQRTVIWSFLRENPVWVTQ